MCSMLYDFDMPFNIRLEVSKDEVDSFVGGVDRKCHEALEGEPEVCDELVLLHFIAC